MTASRPGPLTPRIPAWLGALALGVFAALSLCTDAATRFYQWPWFFYWQVLLVVPPAVLLIRLLRARPAVARFGGWLDAGFALFCAANLAAAFRSPFIHQSLNAALIPVAAVCLAYATLDWLRRDPGRREARSALLDRILGAGMALFVVVSLGLWLSATVLPYWFAHRQWGDALRIPNLEPLGHHVYTAGFAVLCLPWLAGLALTTARRERRLWLTAAGLALVLLPTTASRAGVVAIGVVLVGMAGLWLTQASTVRRSRRLALAAAALVAVAVLAGLDPRIRSLMRHGHWSAIATESNVQRWAMLDAGWLMGRDRPLTGYGPGTVALVYPRYRAQLPGGVEDVLQLHDTPAQFWAELGVPGVLAVLMMIIGVGGLAGEAWRRRVAPAPAGRVRLQAGLAALGGYAVFSFFDYQLDVPLFAAALAVLLARLAAGAAEASDRSAPRLSAPAARAAGWALLASLVALVGATLPNLRARHLFARAADARLRGDNTAFVAGTEHAAAVAPWEPFFLTQLAAYYGEQTLHAPTTAEQTRTRDACIALLRRALRANPDQDYCHFNLGWLLLASDPAAAVRHFRAAARLSPHRSGVYLGVGLGELADHHRAAAVEAFALGWLNHPSSLTSPLWDTAPLQALRGDVVAAVDRQARRWGTREPAADPLRRRTRYVAALAAWWFGRPADVGDLIACGTPAQQAFFRHLAALDGRTYQPAGRVPPLPWEGLYLAWRAGDISRDPRPPPPSLAAALQRRIAAEPGSFIRFLTAPADRTAGLVRYFRNERLGYSVLVRNQDGFIMRDLYIFPENLLVKEYASFLFPAKGYLPGRLLLQSLARLPSPPP